MFMNAIIGAINATIAPCYLFFFFLREAIVVFMNATIGPCKTRTYSGVYETPL